MSGFGKAFGLTGVLVGAALPATAQAVTNTVTFTGTVTTSCSINIVNGTGTMVANGALTSMSSKNAGGAPAKVSITTTGGVRVSLDAVSAATAPAADTGPTTWVSTYALSGAQTVAETSTSTLMTSSGTSTMDINLTGTKATTDTLRGGSYAATVTVRCE